MKNDQKLQMIREKIDSIDEKIKKLLGQRLKFINEIANFKHKNGIKTLDKDREATILKKIKGKFEKAVFRKILSESKKQQSHLNK